MPKYRSQNDWDDEDDFDDGYDDDYGDDDDAEVDTKVCPYCRAEIYEEAEECPECGNYLTGREGAAGGKPMWIVVTVIVLAGVFLIYAIR